MWASRPTFVEFMLDYVYMRKAPSGCFSSLNMGTKIQLTVKIAFPIVIFTFHSVYDKIKTETSLFDF